MAAPQTKRAYAGNALLYLFLVAGAVVAVNLIGSRKFGHVDLTEAGIYTLAKASKDVVRALPDNFSIKAYITSDLPPEMQATSSFVRDLLDEYRAASNGKLRFEAIDPGKDKKAEEEASRCKVRKMQVQVMRKEKFELGAHFLGLCFEYGGQQEAIPQVAGSMGLEYQVSSLIKRMTQRKKKVAFTTGHGEHDLSQGFSALSKVLAQEFDTTTVNPSSAEIGDDVDAVVVGGPKQPLDDKARREIDKHLMKGKGAIFLADGMAMTTPRGQGMEMMDSMPKIAQANQTGLDELLTAYGFKIGQDLVMDPKNMAPGPIEVGGRLMIKTMPVFVASAIQGEKDLTVTAGIKAAIFPFSSSVTLVGPLAGGAVPAGGKLWTLARSSSEAWKHDGFFFFSPEMKMEEGKERGEVGLAYAYRGPLRSAFAPKDGPALSAPDAPPSESRKPVRLLVVGDSDFAGDDFVRLGEHPLLAFYTGGAQLLVNAISWTLEDEALTPVRSKTVVPRPITVSEEKVPLIKTANVAGVPLAFCAFGFVRWRVRRARRLAQKL